MTDVNKSFKSNSNIKVKLTKSILNCTPPNIKVIKSGKIRCATHVARMGKMKSAYRIVIDKTERNIPLRKPTIIC